MSNIVNLKEKKHEKIQQNINNTIDGFGRYLDEEIFNNKEQILTESIELEDEISILENNEGFDIRFKDVLNSEFVMGVRCLTITGYKTIIIGGYGFNFEIYNTTETSVKDIVKNFLGGYVVKEILSIYHNYEIF